ncbi:Common central domain of tyrosinase [Phytophthora infestans]|uniref:Common central domain of tyrosinase n=1 Tax=Phytophthora infestans TaxID=4787 RepID=A0A833W147_PHYIN|nr:Common central domain of tyrosinase [Phytophthora infestans]KAF4146050.1 Common central domain of tyrosinase [Phytophthora infestans]
MTAVEKSTYKGALAAAMDSGAYIKFVEIHTEMKSEMEAHKQCMFIYWHRLFLVVFENMLRGQGPEYACVTIPYFNWIETSNKALSGECKTLGDCSPIMKELGGLTGNTQQTVVINGKNITGTWGSAKVPASISYASVIGQLFNGTNIEKVSRTVERGCHADIHAALGSTMAKFQCPADPIFWSHHAMLDALLTIFHKCRVGTRRMTFEEKAADPVAWASCKRRVRKNPTGPPFKPTDAVAMRTGENGSNPIEASEDPVIGRYLKGVPNRFADLMDGSDLGTNSYTDEINGLLAVMYNTCGGTEPVADTRAPVSSLEGETSNGRNFFDWFISRVLPKESRARRRLSSCRTSTATKEIIPPVSSRSKHSVPVVIAFNLTRSEKRMMNWYNETMSLNGGQSIADMKRQICMFHDQCLGGIVDYTDDFKALWGVKEPRCKTIVNAISNGEQKIVDSAWKSKMEAHFGCPHPVNKTVTREFE